MVMGINWGWDKGALKAWYPRAFGLLRFDFQDTADCPLSAPLTGGLAIKKIKMVGL